MLQSPQGREVLYHGKPELTPDWISAQVQSVLQAPFDLDNDSSVPDEEEAEEDEQGQHQADAPQAQVHCWTSSHHRPWLLLYTGLHSMPLMRSKPGPTPCWVLLCTYAKKGVKNQLCGYNDTCQVADWKLTCAGVEAAAHAALRHHHGAGFVSGRPIPLDGAGRWRVLYEPDEMVADINDQVTMHYIRKDYEVRP